ncbi:MAG: hypothetical protein ABJI96_23450 [Paracoccaceae bacterium]
MPDHNRFSVRKHFEPQRRDGRRLPRVGTLLDDETVNSAVGRFIETTLDHCVLDGVPGTVGQAKWLRSCVQNACVDWDVFHLHVNVSKAVAAKRASLRQVCVSCDSGADPATADSGGHNCIRCGAKLTRRRDDTATGFHRRWDDFQDRFAAFVTLLPPATPVDGTRSNTAPRVSGPHDVGKALAKLVGD